MMVLVPIEAAVRGSDEFILQAAMHYVSVAMTIAVPVVVLVVIVVI